MKKIFLVIAVVMVLASCGNNSSGKEDANDSTSTSPVTDPSYNPKVEADSATKQMNLDTTKKKDTPTHQ